jgi:hypothetical protein
VDKTLNREGSKRCTLTNIVFTGYRCLVGNGGNERISPNPSTQIVNQKSNTVGEPRGGRPGVPHTRFRAFR